MLDPVCVKPGRWSGEVLIKRTHCPGFRVKSDCRRPWGSVCRGRAAVSGGHPVQFAPRRGGVGGGGAGVRGMVGEVGE